MTCTEGKGGGELSYPQRVAAAKIEGHAGDSPADKMQQGGREKKWREGPLKYSRCEREEGTAWALSRLLVLGAAEQSTHMRCRAKRGSERQRPQLGSSCSLYRGAAVREVLA
jgi:hypothetical protein